MTTASAFDHLVDVTNRAAIPDKARILVAVSGGPDSVALLLALIEASRRFDRRWSLTVGHVNHQLRGEESDADERFVCALAAEQDLSVEVERVDTMGHVKATRQSAETAARELRREALEKMLARRRGDRIALGHTLDDQAETVIMRLLRGTGLTGLAGMPAQDGNLVRPFISVPHSTLLKALLERDQVYRIDASNESPAHLRNRIRMEVMPAITAIQPRASEILAREAQAFRFDAGFLEVEARAALTLLVCERTEHEIRASLGVWRALHKSLQRTCVRLLIQELIGHTRDVDEARVAEMCMSLKPEERRGAVIGRLPHGLSIHVDEPHFLLSGRRMEPLSPLEKSLLQCPGSIELVDVTLTAELIERGDNVPQLLAVCGRFHALCDADQLGAPLYVRSRRPGDRMRPIGAPGSRKVQDVMVDRHVPRSLRDSIPVLENDRHVVWIPGIALDERVRITPETRQIVHIRYERRDSTAMTP